MTGAAATGEGRVLWIVGRPASGKTTLARGLVALLRERGVATLWLDSDELRRVLTPDATYDEAERDRFYAALAYLARLGAEGGVTVVVSATGHKRRYRDDLRRVVPRFAEIWLTCEREALHERDVKGLYERALAHEIDNLPGVGAPFEPPTAAELVLDTTRLRPEEALAALVRWLDAAP